MSPHVLVVSRDAMLLQTRQLILGAFFRVQGAGRLREAEEMISTHPFDLIILCYTLSEQECRQIIAFAAERKRLARILVMTPIGIQDSDRRLGDAMMSEASPYYLLKRSAEMLGVDIRAKANLVEA